MSNASSNRYGPTQPSRAQSSNADSYTTSNGPFVDQYVNVVRACHSKDLRLRRMPISSNNELPHVAFPIGKSNGAASVTALYDTGGALNTGNIHLHNFIRKKTPSAVAAYEEFNGKNPFDPIKLCGALLDPSDYNAEKHGILSAVITYYTPFKSIEGKPITFSVALGVDMSVDTIIGIPFIKELNLELKLITPTLIAHSIRTTFPVIYRETVLTGGLKINNDAIDIDAEESTKDICANPPRVSFKSDTRLISAPLASLFQAVAQNSDATSIP